MKIKQLPEDFQVDEVSSLTPSPEGRYALYRLTKSGVEMFEALQRAAQALHAPARSIGFGGLKDAHALTRQPITLAGGPRRSFDRGSVRLDYLGQTDHPADRATFDANRFTLTVRDLDKSDIERLAARWQNAARYGLPNYFDDQRFGSLRQSPGKFIARSAVEGRFEDALRLALATPHRKDHRRLRQVRTLMKEYWGQWDQAIRRLGRSPERRVAEHLAAHPGDFAGAFRQTAPALRQMYAGAYQSYLWNEVLKRVLERRPAISGLRHVDYAAGKLALFESLSAENAAELAALSIPYAHSKMKLGDDPVSALYNEVFAEEGIEPKQLGMEGPSGLIFPRGKRSAMATPKDLTINPPTPDPLNPGRLCVTVSFELPRGAYATLLLK